MPTAASVLQRLILTALWQQIALAAVTVTVVILCMHQTSMAAQEGPEAMGRVYSASSPPPAKQSRHRLAAPPVETAMAPPMHGRRRRPMTPLKPLVMPTGRRSTSPITSPRQAMEAAAAPVTTGPRVAETRPSRSLSPLGKPGLPTEAERPVATPTSGAPVWRRSLEADFMKWVGYIGSLRHSAYAVANNQPVDHRYLIVDPRAVASSPTPSRSRFATIQAAIDAVSVNNVVRTKIFIAPGTYTEKVFIPYNKPFIILQGSNTDTTIIAWNDVASKTGVDNNPIGTFNSATVTIEAPYFIARNITFKNTSPLPIPSSNNSQAVAVRISGDASIFLGCKFLGAQDTLYDHKGRHYFQDCYVEGSVDFIFGNGLSMYRNCHLHAIGAPYQAITAQNRGNSSYDSGFSFVNCKVTGSGPLYLGRAWGTFSRVVYSFTYMDNIVLPKGWNDWNDPKRQLTVYYGQFRCYGPGSNASGRVSWSKELTLHEAKSFIDLTFIDGNEWSPTSYSP